MTGRVKDAAREILPSRTLAPEERLGIYAEMYFLRLRDALVNDYPALRALLGAGGFEKLARAYLAKHPSRHPSLNRLGDRLPGYLARKTVRVPRRALLHDVARLELAVTEVFDEKRDATLDAKALEGIAPEAWAAARFELIAASRLLALDHRVNALVTAARREEPLPAVQKKKKKSFLVVYRKDYVVWRLELEEAAYRILEALARGVPLGRAIALSKIDDPERVFAWFQEWRKDGLFASVSFPRKKRKRR